MLQFLLGGLLSDKQTVMIERMKQLYAQEQIQQVFYLVPDHMKFDSEIEILRQYNGDHALSGSIHTQVYSFTRLAWFLLKDTGLLTQRALSQSGLSMLLRHTLLQLEADLVIYRGQVHKQGFIEQLLELFLEFKSGHLTADWLKQESVDTEETKQVDIAQKIAELSQIYEAFTQALVGHYIAKDDLLDALVSQILTSDLSQTAVFVHGYERFTAQEIRVVEALLTKAHSVTMTLPIVNPQALAQENFLSYVPVQTYHRLLQIAKKHHVKVLVDQWVTTMKPAYQADMRQLITTWENMYTQHVTNDSGEKEDNQALTTTAFANKTEEVNAVIKEITRLVAMKQYRYKDIHILMRQVEDYEDLIRPLFKESQLPVFIDNAESMANHPLVECLSALQAIADKNWQYEDVMRLLRTQLMALGTIEEIDLLEQELLKQGYVYRYWWEHEDSWGIHESVRQRITQTILPFLDELKQAETMAQASRLLYHFLVTSGVKQAVLNLRNAYLDEGQLEKAKQQEQVWQTFTTLLDEFVLILGERVYDSHVFYETLLSGFQQTEYSLVPPSLDQLTVSSVDSKYVSPAKVVFVLGAGHMQFPKSYDNTTLLNDKEREWLQQRCHETAYLGLPTKYRTMIEPYVAYHVFARASEKLYISYAKDTQQESPYMRLLSQRFNPQQLPVSYGAYHQMVREVLRQFYDAYTAHTPIDQTAKALWAYLITHAEFKKRLQPVAGSLTYQNIPVRLADPKALYEGKLHLSVSQLEMYFKDPYSHFLQYGLRLKEREILEANAADIGNVTHDTLDQLYKTLHQQQQRIEQLDDQQLTTLVQQTLQQVMTHAKYRVFSRNNTMRFTQVILADTLQYVARTLRDYARIVPIETVATEWSFDSVDRKDPQTLRIAPVALENGEYLHLRGKIDRMDIVDGQYMSIVDYKSSDKKFDPQKFFMGTGLQLMTYLHVMSLNHQQFHVAKEALLGAFYYHMHYKYELVDKAVDTRERKLQKLSGPIVLPSHLANQVADISRIYPMQLTKSGEYYATMKNVITPDQIGVYFDYLQYKIKQAGDAIWRGDIPLSPLENERFLPSLEQYRSVSLFDATLPENQKRQLPIISDLLTEMNHAMKGGQPDA